MKAIIAEIQGKHAAALLEDGRFIRVENRGYALGQQIVLTQRKRANASKLWMQVAAAFMLVLGLSGSLGYLYLQPAASISVDINPSLQLTLNRFLRVLSVEAVNGDGMAAIEALDLESFRHHSAVDAVEGTIARLYSAYGAGGEPTYVVLSASATDASQEDALLGMVEQAAASVTDDLAGLTVLSYRAEQAAVKEAQALGTTPGRLALVRSLTDDLTADEPAGEAYWVEQPIQAIVAEASHTDSQPDAGEGIPSPTGTPSPSPAPTMAASPSPSPAASAAETPAQTPAPEATETPAAATRSPGATASAAAAAAAPAVSAQTVKPAVTARPIATARQDEAATVRPTIRPIPTAGAPTLVPAPDWPQEVSGPPNRMPGAQAPAIPSGEEGIGDRPAEKPAPPEDNAPPRELPE